PNTGRFTQPDPSGQEKNPYLYAEGDPVNRIDPKGLNALTSFASKAAKRVGEAGDVIAIGQAASQISKGDYRGAASTAVGFVSDKGFTAGCTYLSGSVGAVPCAVGGQYVGNKASEAFDDATE
ncbi:RHS repeat-associated core domain-containing protein, partial [Streptomyces sp. NPDC057910]|uniref:RHS repeat-associated core domain-containing protein n=1 Tax=Streptomyces sp. NPDC057910 TaxID=3346278 RepID=UPI0036EE30FA